MAKVTSIKPRGRSTDRFVVSLDDEAFAVVGVDLLMRLSLHVNDELDEQAQANLAEAAGELGAYDRAMRLLVARGRSRAGLQRKLVEKGETSEHAARAVEKLSTQGFLDDEAFARSFVRSKARKHGRRRIEMELARNGVERSVATAALDEVMADPTLDTHDVLDQLVIRKIRELARYDAVTRRRRIFGVCVRRGFSTGETLAAIARHEEEKR